MTYQVLARKWRPRTFEQLVGQTHVTQALTHALNTQKLHHAYLFSGTRGVGKTTIARILAKCLNCEQGVSATPCETCSVCLEVNAGRFADLIEVDAASRTRVEDTRELLDNVIYAPTQGRTKIYLIDEVHMLSGHSFNALLKTLEEPPSHVVFLLATTDPERLPITVLSRCLQFHLRPITQPLLEKHLQHILTEEKISFDEQALPLLAQAAQGSLRDALSLLEQAIGIGQGEVTRASVESMLGCTYHAHLSDLLQAISQKQAPRAFELVELLYSNGTDFKALLDALLGAFHAWAVCQALPDQEQAMIAFSGLPKEVIELHQAISAEQIQLLYQMTLQSKQDLPWAPSWKAGFEMLVLRLMHFRPFEEQAIESVPAAQPQSQQTVAKPQSSAVQAKPAQAPTAPPKSTSFATKPKQTTVVAPASQSNHHSTNVDWPSLASQLQLVGLTKVLVQNCTVAVWELPKVQLVLDAKQAVCLNDERRQKIQEALSQHLQQPIHLTIHSGDVAGTSPHEIEQSEKNARQEKAESMLKQDPVAQQLINTFDAHVEQVTLIDDQE